MSPSQAMAYVLDRRKSRLAGWAVRAILSPVAFVVGWTIGRELWLTVIG